MERWAGAASANRSPSSVAARSHVVGVIVGAQVIKFQYTRKIARKIESTSPLELQVKLHLKLQVQPKITTGVTDKIGAGVSGEVCFPRLESAGD